MSSIDSLLSQNFDFFRTLNFDNRALWNLDRDENKRLLLQSLSHLFDSLWLERFSLLQRDILWTEKKDSHLKQNLFFKKMGSLDFRIDLLQFTGKARTGVHTHSEIHIDGVIEGALSERCFVPAAQGLQFSHHGIRRSGDIQRHMDPAGSPHCVKAIHGPAFLLSLSYGRPVSYGVQEDPRVTFKSHS